MVGSSVVDDGLEPHPVGLELRAQPQPEAVGGDAAEVGHRLLEPAERARAVEGATAQVRADLVAVTEHEVDQRLPADEDHGRKSTSPGNRARGRRAAEDFLTFRSCSRTLAPMHLHGACPMLLNALNDLGDLGDAPKVAQTILALIPTAASWSSTPTCGSSSCRARSSSATATTPSTTVGRDLHDVIPASSWDAARRALARGADGRVAHGRQRSADGQRDYWLHFAPLQTKAGVVGAIMIAQDISDRVRRARGDPPIASPSRRRSAPSARSRSGARPLPELFEAAAQVLHGALASDVVDGARDHRGRRHLGPRERRRGAAPPA